MVRPLVTPLGVRRALQASIVLALASVSGTTESKPWRAVTSPGDLAKAHAGAEDNCERCHLVFKGVPNEKCLACHESLALRIDTNKGFHASVAKRPCIECHTDHRGRTLSMTRTKASVAFDHHETGFALDGAHRKLDCKTCHTQPIANVSATCASCHDDPHKGGLGTSCQSCHVSSGWKREVKTLADHKVRTDGGHAKLECAKCHAKGAHLEGSVACGGCHEAEHGGTRAACDVCHQVSAWTPATFDHLVCTCVFPGKHQTFACLSCHPSWKFTQTPKVCSGCHAAIQKHEPLGECSLCHSALSWKRKDRFDHNKRSTFKLSGEHLAVDCSQCHTQAGQFRGAPRVCEGCHEEDGRDAHGDFGACASCHVTNGFDQPTFDHDSTKFRLTGKHKKLPCQNCHAEKTQGFPSPKGKTSQATGGDRPSFGRFDPALFASLVLAQSGQPAARAAGTATVTSTASGGPSSHPATPEEQACSHCHTDPHGGSVGSECARCHLTESWRPSTFDRNRHESTSFPLKGRHAETACKLCHAGGDLKPLPMECSGCHLDPHRGKLGTACSTCHDESGFAPVPSFDHGTTGFTLVGPHGRSDCARCHEGPRGDALLRAEKPTDCQTCHEPGHGKELGSNCASCHPLAPDAEAPITFRTARGMPFFEHDKTGFSLDRRHRAQPCKSCHPRGGPAPIARCSGCHLDPHSGQLGQACDLCHKADRFRLARFDHDRAGWPLRGRHFVTPCASCHTSQRWVGLSTDCFDCHALDAARAKAKVGIHPFGPSDCRDCHFSLWRWP